MVKKSINETSETVKEPTQSYPEHPWRHWRQHKQPRASIGGLLLILIGLIFLFSNFGLLSPAIWRVIWRFWPVFLILWGLQMLGTRSRVLTIIMTVLGILIILAVLAIALASTNPQFASWLRTQFPLLGHLSFSDY